METTARPDARRSPRCAEPTLDDLLGQIAPGARLGPNRVVRLRVGGMPEELLAAVFTAADRRHLDSYVDGGWLTIEPDPAAQAELEFLALQHRLLDLTADGVVAPLRNWTARRARDGGAAIARLVHAVW